MIESTSREALVEMRRLLGVLRQENEGAAMRPMLGLADIPSPRGRDAASRARGDA